jgi:dephospho-CoA kinase
MKVGITGGIGSGKSYVCKRLAKCGITVYDCDAAAKRLIRTSPILQEQIISLVGSLEKSAMSRFLLASEANQQAMNAIIHPAVFRDFEASGIEWMESAILFESGARELVDKVVVVTAPQDVRIQRIMLRDGITREKALQWISCQWSQDEVKAHADYEIINDGLADLDSQIEKILESLGITTLLFKKRMI